MQQRPFGVAVLAIAAAVLGAFALIGAGAWWNASEALVWLPSVHAERFIALVSWNDAELSLWARSLATM